MKKQLFSLAVCLVATQQAVSAQQSGLDLSGVDSSVRIQDDLFRHVNGTWLKTTEIPADKSNYGSFIQLDDLSRERMKATIEEAAGAAATAAPGSDTQKIGDFYRSFMDEETANRRGIGPVKDLLESYCSFQSHRDVFEGFAQLGVLGVSTPVGLYVGVDEKNSTAYLTSIVQGGTMLPDREYYLNQLDPKYDDHRKALVAYVDRLAGLGGISGDQIGLRILELETRLAAIRWSRVEMRDAKRTYNKYSVTDLALAAPGLEWADFFRLSGVEGIESVNVVTPSYFERLALLVSEIPVETWQYYLQVRLLDEFAPYLSDDFVQVHFGFHGTQLAGIEQLKPRWKRAVETIAGGGAGDFGALGEMVGRLYVAKHFPAESKAQMERLVANLLKSFEDSIGELEWMTAETREQARIKLSKITTKIGYPDQWRDYSALMVKPDDLVGNILRSRRIEHDRNVTRLGKPVDRMEWGMTPQTVNAYYNPSMNEIVFPAAILQPPFFDPQAPAALNYGGIGAVIGHEISHAFDDQGSEYDGDGNLRNWWTDADREAFRKLTERLVNQYSTYSPLPDKFVNGKLTLGENIADLSGLSIAYKAYQLEKGGVEPAAVAGWTGNQLFFVGWSRVWQRKYRDSEMLNRLLSDPHSPSEYRANGPVQNIDAFFEAFDVKPGDGLYKPAEERIRIW